LTDWVATTPEPTLVEPSFVPEPPTLNEEVTPVSKLLNLPTKTAWRVPGFGKKQEPQLDPEPQEEDPAKITNRAGTAATDELATTLHEMLLPLLKRLDAIANVPDAAIQQHMIEKLLKDFPQIAEAIKADDSLAKQIHPQLAQAMIAGLSQKKP
jgi:hypothetical protein